MSCHVWELRCPPRAKIYRRPESTPASALAMLQCKASAPYYSFMSYDMPSATDASPAACAAGDRCDNRTPKSVPGICEPCPSIDGSNSIDDNFVNDDRNLEFPRVSASPRPPVLLLLQCKRCS